MPSGLPDPDQGRADPRLAGSPKVPVPQRVAFPGCVRHGAFSYTRRQKRGQSGPPPLVYRSSRSLNPPVASRKCYGRSASATAAPLACVAALPVLYDPSCHAHGGHRQRQHDAAVRASPTPPSRAARRAKADSWAGQAQTRFWAAWAHVAYRIQYSRYLAFYCLICAGLGTSHCCCFMLWHCWPRAGHCRRASCCVSGMPPPLLWGPCAV